ncbi:MAG TPA: MliC family protein [Phenylobacterium sp.]|nr:MliC family protein [Phenylobacterium sp.]
MAQQTMQPPMNDFYEAFYNCEGGAFLVSYDSDMPERATVTTNLRAKKYELKRAPTATGVKFSGEAARFWTDGKTVTLEGTETPLKNCKIKGR